MSPGPAPDRDVPVQDALWRLLAASSRDDAGQLLDGLDWGLEYDAAFGLLNQTTQSPLRTLLGMPTVVGPMLVLGTRVALQTPVPGLRVLGTLARTSPRPSGVPALDAGPLARRGVTTPGLSVELARERLLVQAERHVDVQAYLRSWLARVQCPNAVRLTVDVDPVSFF